MPEQAAKTEPRVGVYVCHCGTNIAATVDVRAVATYAATLPGVAIAREYKYLCSDPGQQMILDDIRANHLNRVVVASCSPMLHERTFRNVLVQAGLNPFLMQMVNIREHVSWVHESKEAATAKSCDLVRAAVRRVRLHVPLEKRKVAINPNVLVVGGGIAGIHAALTLANSGKRVYMVEREATIGGHMAQFDKTFPTLDCAACILTPKMTSVRSHPMISLWTMSEVTKVDGYVGNYKVTVRHNPRYVDEEKCVGCQECVEACIFKDARFPDKFNEGLGKRKPIYMPFPQAVPQKVLIDRETCIEFKSGKCKKTCVTACAERNAIDFKQQPREEEIEVGAIILATGFKTFDPRRSPYYGYGKLQNVYTSLEVERLVNASGPTGGEIIMRDGRRPESIAFIHCVGSRDLNTNVWCSKTCCMHSLKLMHLLNEHTDADIYSFYIDIRAAGKGYEEFYNRLMHEGSYFIRGRVAEVSGEPMSEAEIDKLVVVAEDTLAGFVRRVPVDMVVLAVGMEPQADANDVRRLFNISCSSDGWFLERHPKLAPVSTFTDGIFIAGACQAPKDIPDSVAQAGAAASEAMALIDAKTVELEPYTASINAETCSGCKTCIPLCPYHAIAFKSADGHAEVNEVLCKGCGTCTAACPSGSINQNFFSDQELFEEIEGVMACAATH